MARVRTTWHRCFSEFLKASIDIWDCSLWVCVKFMTICVNKRVSVQTNKQTNKREEVTSYRAHPNMTDRAWQAQWEWQNWLSSIGNMHQSLRCSVPTNTVRNESIRNNMRTFLKTSRSCQSMCWLGLLCYNVNTPFCDNAFQNSCGIFLSLVQHQCLWNSISPTEKIPM